MATRTRPAATAVATLAGSGGERLDTGVSPPAIVVHPAEDGSADFADLRLGVSCPALFFAIPLKEEALVTIHCQELNSASRCALLLSPSDPRPSEETAVWRLLSPDPVKSLVIHPADDNYPAATASGKLYLALRYLEDNGNVFVNLGVRLQPSFYSVWYRREIRLGSAAGGGATTPPLPLPIVSNAITLTNVVSGNTSRGFSLVSAKDLSSCEADGAATATGKLGATVSSSLYIGSWLGRHPHGRGVCFYDSAPADLGAGSTSFGAAAAGASTEAATLPLLLLLQTMFERRSMPWSAFSLPERPTLEGTPLDAKFIAQITGFLDTRDAEQDGGAVATAPATNSNSNSNSSSSSAGSEECESLDEEDSSGGSGGSYSNGRDGVETDKAREEGRTPPSQGWKVIQAPIYDEGIEAYDGEWVRGRKEGHGVYQWNDCAYVGQWRCGQRHGRGHLRCESGAYYKGEWRNDKRHGHGEALLMPEGNVYCGEWRDGLQEGRGSLRYPNGVVVSGNWTSGALEDGAMVTAVYPDGTRYVGAWQDDCRHGPGSLTDTKGCVHEHTWLKDKRHGGGSIRLHNGVRFEGEWDEDRLVGGTFWFPNGDAYQGDWDDARAERSGHGTCRTKLGDTYEGEWLRDKRHGQGTMRYASGAVYTGSWVHGEPDGEGRLEDNEGVFEGSFERGVRSGHGEQRSSDGSVYTGEWRHGHRSGHGSQYDASNNVTYTGIFLHDRLQGHGGSVKRVAADQTEVYTGTWLDGQEQGHGTLRLPSGDVVRGVWHRGKQVDGRVELVSVDGGCYVGDWQAGVRSGRGTQVAADGATVYEGEWRDNQPHGRGRLTRANGESVECDWEQGSMLDSPCGVVEFLDGSVYTGEMRQGGVPHGQGSLLYPDGTIFEGTFENGVYML